MSGGQREDGERQRYSRRTRGAADPDACAGLGLDGLGCSAGQPYYIHTYVCVDAWGANRHQHRAQMATVSGDTQVRTQV